MFASLLPAVTRPRSSDTPPVGSSHSADSHSDTAPPVPCLIWMGYPSAGCINLLIATARSDQPPPSKRVTRVQVIADSPPFLLLSVGKVFRSLNSVVQPAPATIRFPSQAPLAIDAER